MNKLIPISAYAVLMLVAMSFAGSLAGDLRDTLETKQLDRAAALCQIDEDFCHD